MNKSYRRYVQEQRKQRKTLAIKRFLATTLGLIAGFLYAVDVTALLTGNLYDWTPQTILEFVGAIVFGLCAWQCFAWREDLDERDAE